MYIDLAPILYVALVCFAAAGLLLLLACFWTVHLLVQGLLRRAWRPVAVTEGDIREEPDFDDFMSAPEHQGVV